MIWCPRVVLAVALVLATVAVAQDDDQLFYSEGNTKPVTAQTSATLPPVAATPVLKYQQYAAGEYSAVYTYTTSDRLPAGTVATALPARDSVSANLPSYTINLKSNDHPATNVQAVCWYPISGYYGPLSRYLFYVTLVFALVARVHEWLIIGALAASLTFSASAAIHAIVMVFSNASTANNDSYAVLGILMLSASLILPLLNWSKTIRNLGKDHEENSAGRTIIIYWGFLIFTGFICQFIAFYRTGLTSTGTAFKIAAWSQLESVTCSPSSGALDLTADQQQGWNALYLTDKFIEANSCTEPCRGGLVDAVGNPLVTILRDPNELVSLSASQVNHFAAGNLTKKQQLHWEWYAIGFLGFGMWTLVWLILQGITVTFFGRKSPRQVRNTVYVRLSQLLAKRDKSATSNVHATLDTADRIQSDRAFDRRQHKLPSRVAKTIAFGMYLWSWSALFVSIPLAIASIVANEYWMHGLPQSNEMYSIDQWAAWSVTALVLLVAFAYEFQGIAEDVLVRIFNAMLGCFYRCFHGRRYKGRNPKLETHRLETNRQMIGLLFTGYFIDKTYDLYHTAIVETKHELVDLANFLWKDPWKTAVENQGQSHLRPRRPIAGDKINMPQGWANEYAEWLDLEMFIKAVRHFDERHRQLHGRGYKWQPRVAEELQLRTAVDRQLFRDLWRRSGNGKSDEEAHVRLTEGGLETHEVGLVEGKLDRQATVIEVRVQEPDDLPAHMGPHKPSLSSEDSDDDSGLPPRHFSPDSYQALSQSYHEKERASTTPTATTADTVASPPGTLGGATALHVPRSRYSLRQERYNAAILPPKTAAKPDGRSLETAIPPIRASTEPINMSQMQPVQYRGPSAALTQRSATSYVSRNPVSSRSLTTSPELRYHEEGTSFYSSFDRTTGLVNIRSNSHHIPGKSTATTVNSNHLQRLPSYGKSQRPAPGRQDRSRSNQRDDGPAVGTDRGSGGKTDKMLPPPPPPQISQTPSPDGPSTSVSALSSAGQSGSPSRDEKAAKEGHGTTSSRGENKAGDVISEDASWLAEAGEDEQLLSSMGDSRSASPSISPSMSASISPSEGAELDGQRQRRHLLTPTSAMTSQMSSTAPSSRRPG